MSKLSSLVYKHIPFINLIRYMLISVVLAILTVLVDWRIIPLTEYLPDITMTSTEMAKTILSTLAAAFLSITIFSFSTILSVLSVYSSNMTPRIVENFLQKKITMKVLGSYIGGFSYCVISLVAMRDALDQMQVLAGMIGAIYSVVCVLYFVSFVYTVSKSMRMSEVINELSQEALDNVESICEQVNDKKATIADDAQNSQSLSLDKAGYLEGVDYEKLKSIFEEQSGQFIIIPRIGDHVPVESEIARYTGNEALTEEDTEKILKTFNLDYEHNSSINYRYSIIKIVEIAVRALSPGINDPSTAINCLNKLGLILSKLAQVNDDKTAIEVNESFHIFSRQIDFEEDLYATFWQIAHYGGGDIMVAKAILENLQNIAYLSTPGNQDVLNKFIEKVREHIRNEYELESDLAHLHLN